MSAQTIIFALVTFLHDLFTAVWIGGLITLGLTVMPSVKKVLGKGPQTKKSSSNGFCGCHFAPATDVEMSML